MKKLLSILIASAGLGAMLLWVVGCGYGQEIDQNNLSVIGGTATSEFPEVVALIPLPTNQSGELDWSKAKEARRLSMCTGTIISSRVVLTAAHCVHDDQIRSRLSGLTNSSKPFAGQYKMVVFLGPNVRDPEDHSPQKAGQWILGTQLIAHENYVPLFGVLGNDMGLVLLSEEVNHIEPAELYDKDLWSYFGKNVQVHNVGYGFGDEDCRWLFCEQTGNGIKRLADAQLKFVSNKPSGRFIYASARQDGAYTTAGDSGGPVVMVENGIRKVIGVHSWGDQGMLGGWGLSERVDLHYDWIRSQLDQRGLWLSSR